MEQDRALAVSARVVRELRSTYTDEGVRVWLHSRNRNLARRRPINLLVAGQLDTVLREAQHVAAGM